MSKSKLNRVAKSWIAYDMGNSAFATTVLGAFFPLFFTSYWAGGMDEITITKNYTAGLTIINVIILIMMPIIGAITDVRSLTKTFFILFTCISSLTVGSFYFIDYGQWILALSLYGIALFCFAASLVLYDKILLFVSSNEDVTKISGYGYAFGYLGGGILFVINSFMVLNPSFFGLPSGSEGVVLATKWSFVSVTVWWLIFSMPIFIFYKQLPFETEGSFSDAFRQIFSTFRHISENKNIALFLLAFFFYIDAVHTIMQLAAMFGDGIGIDQSSIIYALILVQFVAFPATLFWSYFGSRYGDKNVIYLTIFVYLFALFFSSTLNNATDFFILAFFVGSIQGGIQASSRSLFAKIIPEDKAGELFGFYNTFGRAGSVLGPLLINIFLSYSNDLKVALIPLAIIFLIGLVLLYFVKER